MRYIASLASLFLLAFLTACGGGHSGGGPTGPTAPPPQATSLNATFVLNSAFEGGGVIEDHLLLDGKEIAKGDYSNTRGGCQLDCQLTAIVSGVAAGGHTLTLSVTRQSKTRINYLSLGILIYSTSTGQGSKEVELPQRNTTLLAGEAITYSFTL